MNSLKSSIYRIKVKNMKKLQKIMENAEGLIGIQINGELTISIIPPRPSIIPPLL